MNYAAAVLDPQLVAAQARHAEILKELDPMEAGIAGERHHFAQSRQWWNEGGPTMAEVRDEVIPGPHRDIPATVYVPSHSASPRPAFVYLHGGGYRLGAPRSNDRQLREIAAAWGGIVVSIDYAHMPEHVFPVAVEEAAAAFAWLSQHGSGWGIDGMRLAFGGSSAGANVAMGAAMQAGGINSGYLKAGACVVGVFDDSLDTASMTQYGEQTMPNRNSARAMFAAYAAEAIHRADPRFNLLLADPALWTPLFLAAAECDIYKDSSVRFAAHAQRGGSHVKLKTYAGMTHLFFGYSRMVSKAAECAFDVAAFLEQELPA